MSGKYHSMVAIITTVIKKEKNMAQYQDILQQIGLAKNEARIYETLLREGESGVGHIAEKSGVHRRNVYDSLNRLIEKGLVYEVFQQKENRYRAVDPGKLAELIQEKKEKLSSILPDLSKIYSETPYYEELFLYKGVEGWKNYLNDILRIGDGVLLIGAVDNINDPDMERFMEHFYHEVRRKKISYRVLFRADTKLTKGKVSGELAKISTYRILKEKYTIGSAATIVGDRVFLFSDTFSEGKVLPEVAITVIKNKDIAASFRIFFECLWDMSEVSR